MNFQDPSQLSNQFLKTIQHAVGVDADGAYGPKTAAAIAAFDGPLPLPVRMVDVSHWQGDLPQAWFDARFAEGVLLCGVKLSQGVSGRDPKGAQNLERAKLAGMKTIAYHFANPKCDDGNAVANARNFTSAVADNGALVDCEALDFESHGDGKADLSAWVAVWFSHVDTSPNQTILYAGAEFLRLCNEPARPLWWPAYHGGSDPKAPRDVAIWQYGTPKIDDRPIDCDAVAAEFWAVI